MKPPRLLSRADYQHSRGLEFIASFVSGNTRASILLGFLGKMVFLRSGELVTRRGWPNASVSWTSTASPASYPGPRSEASSAILWPWSSPCHAAEKDALRGLRAGLPHLLRQAA